MPKRRDVYLAAAGTIQGIGREETGRRGCAAASRRRIQKKASLSASSSG
jgi:hypothetical protein